MWHCSGKCKSWEMQRSLLILCSSDSFIHLAFLLFEMPILQVFTNEHYSTTTLSSLSVFFSSVQFPLFNCDCDAPSKSHYSFMCQTDRGTHMRPHIYFRLEIGGKIAARTKQRLCYTFSFAPRTLDRGPDYGGGQNKGSGAVALGGQAWCLRLAGEAAV